MNATAKQIAYATHLLDNAGYNTKWMDSSFKALGATMRQCSGSVEAWLSGMSRRDISKLITELRTREIEGEDEGEPEWSIERESIALARLGIY